MARLGRRDFLKGTPLAVGTIGLAAGGRRQSMPPPPRDVRISRDTYTSVRGYPIRPQPASR